MTLADLDIVIPVRTGANEELRYTLRAIDAHVPHRKVWLIGGRPDWVQGVEHLEHSQHHGKYQNVRNARRLAATHPGITERFMLWNDDMFAMQPVGDVPALHRGPVAPLLAAYQRRVGLSGYVIGMRDTAALLEAQGCAEPLSYELHVPIVLEQAKLLSVLDLGEQHLTTPHVRTLYGNIFELGGDEMDDVKVYDLQAEVPQGPWLSSSDEAFTEGSVGHVVRYHFPDAGRYEKR